MWGEVSIIVDRQPNFFSKLFKYSVRRGQLTAKKTRIAWMLSFRPNSSQLLAFLVTKAFTTVCTQQLLHEPLRDAK